MEKLKSRTKLAAISKETPENTGNNQSQYILNVGMAEEYNTQLSKEIEKSVSKKLCQELGWTESRILAALSILDEFVLNRQVPT